MVGPKMQAFCPRIVMLKGKRCILRIRGAPVRQKVPKSYFQSQFSMSKIKSKFFLDSIFEPLYFLKLGPIFEGPKLCQFTKYSSFI